MQIGGRTIQPWQAVLAAAVVVGLIAGGIALAQSRGSADNGLGTPGIEEADGTTSGEGAQGSVDATPGQKSTDASAPARPGTNSKPGGGTSTNGGKPSSPSTGSPSDPAKPPAKPGETRKIKFIFWNDTNAKAPTGAEIWTSAYGSWKPTNEQNWEVHVFTFPVGQPIDLIVYADGRSGKKITVPLSVSVEAVDNSDQDAVHVAVSDDKVRVLGGPVQDFDVSFDRF